VLRSLPVPIISSLGEPILAAPDPKAAAEAITLKIAAHADREVEMPKLLDSAHRVHRSGGYKAYMAATPAAHDKYGGRALVRGGTQEVVEAGPAPATCYANFRTIPRRSRAIALRNISARSRCAFPIRLRFRDHRGHDGVQPPPPATPPAAAARKAIGSRTRCHRPRGLQGVHGANKVHWKNSAGASWCAAAAARWSRARLRARTVVLEFPSIVRRSIATDR